MTQTECIYDKLEVMIWMTIGKYGFAFLIFSSVTTIVVLLKGEFSLVVMQSFMNERFVASGLVEKTLTFKVLALQVVKFASYFWGKQINNGNYTTVIRIELKGIDMAKSWPGPGQKYNLLYSTVSTHPVSLCS